MPIKLRNLYSNSKIFVTAPIQDLSKGVRLVCICSTLTSNDDHFSWHNAVTVYSVLHAQFMICLGHKYWLRSDILVHTFCNLSTTKQTECTTLPWGNFICSDRAYRQMIAAGRLFQPNPLAKQNRVRMSTLTLIQLNFSNCAQMCLSVYASYSVQFPLCNYRSHQYSLQPSQCTSSAANFRT